MKLIDGGSAGGQIFNPATEVSAHASTTGFIYA